jgi:protein-arginine kinase
MLDAKYSYVHSCTTNLGTGMSASVHVDLPGYTKGFKTLEAWCKELHLQPRGTRGESGGQTGKLLMNLFVCVLVYSFQALLHFQPTQTGLLYG